MPPLADELRRLAEREPRRLEPAEELRRERTFSWNSSASLRMRFSNCEKSGTGQLSRTKRSILPRGPLHTHLLDVRLHLLVGKTAQLRLEIPEVVDGAATVGSSDNILSRLTQFLSNGGPRSLYSSDRVDKGTVHLYKGASRSAL